jgi:hypothetical protein
MKYKFGQHSFTSKQAVKKHFSQLLKTKSKITPTDPEWEEVSELFQGHPERDSKVEGQIVRFEVRRTEVGTKCFFVISEGKEIDFSVGACLEEVNDDLKGACREAIVDQVLKAKDQLVAHFGEQCQSCGTGNGISVDHKSKPFSEIYKEFRLIAGYVPNTFDGDIRPRFKAEDEKFKKLWLEFHEIEADYQLLCRSCNSRKGTKKTA